MPSKMVSGGFEEGRSGADQTNKRSGCRRLMFGDSSIAKQLPVVIVTLAVATAVVTGIVAYLQTAHLLNQSAEQKLIALLEAREQALVSLLDDVRNDLDMHRANPWMINALEGFKAAWPELGSDPAQTLQELYVDADTQSHGGHHALIDAEDGSAYSSAHRSFHPSASRFLRSRGLHDLFLFDPEGNLVYSVYKEVDFATNIENGPLTDTGLGRAFRLARDNPTPDFMAFEDFTSFEPSHGAAASFIAAPMLDEEGRLLGVLAYQMPIDRLNAVMQVNAGMGDSGETYVVGEDFLMRSDSRFAHTSTILETVVRTASAERALAGETGVDLGRDYRGVPVLAAYSPIEFLGVRWAILAEVDEAEVLAPLKSLRASLLWVVVATTLIIATVGSILAVKIARPLMEMKDTVLRLANDDLSVVIPAANGVDEVDEMRRALGIFRENAMRRIGAEMRIRHLANHDELTGLPTRRLAKDRLESALLSGKRHSWRVAVMFIDLDGFKAINDRFGHDGGDTLLREVGHRLRDCLRDSDTVARIGGDEFLAIISEFHDDKVATWMVQKLVNAMKYPVLIEGKEVQISASIGVALYPDHGESVDELIKRADQAMYEVKHSGKNDFRISQQQAG